MGADFSVRIAITTAAFVTRSRIDSDQARIENARSKRRDEIAHELAERFGVGAIDKRLGGKVDAAVRRFNRDQPHGLRHVAIGQASREVTPLARPRFPHRAAEPDNLARHVGVRR